MTNLHNLTIAKLRKAVAIKEKVEALQSELDSIGGTAHAHERAAPGRRKKRRMSAATGPASARPKRRAGPKSGGATKPPPGPPLL